MSEDHVEEIASAESLRQLVEERLQSREAANAACRLAGLSIRGNAAQKRGRLLQLISASLPPIFRFSHALALIVSFWGPEFVWAIVLYCGYKFRKLLNSLNSL